jgi:hypothetical protein
MKFFSHCGSSSITRSFSALCALALGILTLLTASDARAADTIDFSRGFDKPDAFATLHYGAKPYDWELFTYDYGTKEQILQLTDGNLIDWIAPEQRASAFYREPVNIQNFSTSFTFQLWNDEMITMGDGFTFCIQNQGPFALGGANSGLGYGPDPYNEKSGTIQKSIALKFDSYQNPGDPSSSSVGLFIKGDKPIGGIDVLPYGIDFKSNHKFRADINYDGKILTLVLTDLETKASMTHEYKVDIQSIVGDSSAYVGFTGSTGELDDEWKIAISAQSLYSWVYKSGAAEANLVGLTLETPQIVGSMVGKGSVVLSAPVQQDTAISLGSLNPAAFTPDVVVVPAGRSSATFPIKTAPTSVAVSGSICAKFGATLLKTTVKVTPIAPDSVTVALNYLPEGQSTTGIIVLQAPATSGEFVVTLTSSNPAVASVPSKIVIPAGQTQVTFPINTGAVKTNTPVLITAGTIGGTRTATLTVRPIRVNSITATPASLTGGNGGALIATLESPAPAGGTTLNLSSGNGAVQVASTIVIPAGSTSAKIPFTTSKVTTKTTVVVTASYRVNNVYANITVNP